MFKGPMLQSITVIALILSFSPAIATDNSTPTPDIEPLPRNHGYMLLGLDIGGTAPSFEYALLRGSKTDRKRKIDRKRKTIELKGKDNGFLLIPIRKGPYQITKINAPLFDLPFRVDTKNSKWQFTIEPNKINYIGHLNIAKKRKSRSVDVGLSNRIATDITKISAEFSELITQYPIITSLMLRDDFYEFYTNKEGE